MEHPQEVLRGQVDGRLASETKQHITKLESVETPLLYRAGIVLVAIGMLILPLIYIAMIFGVGALTGYHAVANLDFISGRGGPSFGRLLVYIAPLVVGVILVIFMIKPLFTRLQKYPDNIVLDPKKEPRFFAFVENICRSVGAPIPKKIDIMCDVNASASYNRGILSFAGQDLCLTVGLPLVAGMTTEQLAGVLAHEFGHFAQKTGMRMTYLIRSISFWFARVANEKEAMNSMLENRFFQFDGRLYMLALLAKFFVWLTSKVLWLMMLVGNVISGFMLRQMEYDADRYEIRFAGSKAFVSTLHQLRRLGYGSFTSQNDLGDAFSEGKLPDNVPALIVSHAENLPPELADHALATIETEKTGIFDTHPCDKDRLAQAHAENAPGIFHNDTPATTLFSDFEALAKQATEKYYTDVLQDQFSADTLVSTTDILTQQDGRREDNKAFYRMQRGIGIVEYPIKPPVYPKELNVNLSDFAAKLEKLRTELVEERDDMVPLVDKYEQLAEKRAVILQGMMLLECGMRLKAKEFHLRKSSTAAAEEALAEVNKEIADNKAAIKPYVDKCSMRMAVVLKLLERPEQLPADNDWAAMHREYQQLLSVHKTLAEQNSQVLKLMVSFSLLNVMFMNLQSHSDNTKLVAKLEKLIAKSHEQLSTIRENLATTLYPFQHAREDMSVGHFLLEKLPDVEEPAQIGQAFDDVFTNFFSLRQRILARFAVLTETVEASLGLAVMPEPKENPADLIGG